MFILPNKARGTDRFSDIFGGSLWGCLSMRKTSENEVSSTFPSSRVFSETFSGDAPTFSLSFKNFMFRLRILSGRGMKRFGNVKFSIWTSITFTTKHLCRWSKKKNVKKKQCKCLKITSLLKTREKSLNRFKYKFVLCNSRSYWRF